MASSLWNINWQVPAAIFCAVSLAWSLRSSSSPVTSSDQRQPSGREKELAATDPQTLAENSTFQTYDTKYWRYPSVRTLLRYGDGKSPRENGGADPVIVFVHGLGGSIAQFEHIIKNISKSATVFGIDFPGCGLSRFAPESWDAYTQEALLELLGAAVEKNFPHRPPLVLIGHSMGCKIAMSFARRSSEASNVSKQTWPQVLGIVAICPDDRKFTRTQELAAAALLTIPTPIFDLYRALDKQGGINSASVKRFTGKSADKATRTLQLSFNDQSQTPVFRRVAWGVVRGTVDGVAGWSKLDPSISLLLIAGANDVITPASAVQTISAAAKSTNAERDIKAKVLRGSHALPYDANGYHSVAALIDEFCGSIDQRLSTTWELRQSATGGKWDVKNYEKWLSVTPVSLPIGKPKKIFLALKTLRGVDETHNPEEFARQWQSRVKAVVDISQDQPVYDQNLFLSWSIEYHKLPTVSKIPPTKENVADFIALIDSLLPKVVSGWRGVREEGIDRSIAVHCHYGFNRTGFFICAYLIERCGYSIEEALEEFKHAKPPGIRHRSFIDQLYLRYRSEELPKEQDQKAISPPRTPTRSSETTLQSQGTASQQSGRRDRIVKSKRNEPRRPKPTKAADNEEDGVAIGSALFA